MDWSLPPTVKPFTASDIERGVLTLSFPVQHAASVVSALAASYLNQMKSWGFLGGKHNHGPIENLYASPAVVARSSKTVNG